MGRVLVVLVVLLVGCSDAAEGDETTVDLGSVAENVRSCEEALGSGDPVTADDVEECQQSAITASKDCDDGREAHVITLDDQTWLYYEGEPAQRIAEDEMYTAACA